MNLKSSSELILLRHGASLWNERNLFTGWVDIPLSSKGIEEARQAGKKIADREIDLIFTSSLIRSIMTAMIAMNEHHSGKIPVILHPGEAKMEEWGLIYGEPAKQSVIPVIKAWELNERMYGALQGLDKDETRKKFGADQVQIWRRSYDVAPPQGESLKMTAERTLPYFKNIIIPELEKGHNILIAAHGNSLRSIMMMIDQLTPDEVVKLELATGDPIVYSYNQGVFSK